jgi:type I restriction enzyme M protein
MLQSNSALKSKIDKLWNKFWAGGISNPLTAIEQITYLLFMKRMDDLDKKNKLDAEFTEESYSSKFEGPWIPPEYRLNKENKTKAEIKEEEKHAIDKETLRWSHFRRLPTETMLTHVQLRVFPFLKELNGGEAPFTAHMKNAVFIIPKPELLFEAIETIEEIFEEIDKDAEKGGQSFQDIQGDVYEMLLSEIATSGKNGQFRTPRHIIKLMAELVAPKLGHRICDPACGTSGFLLGAYQYMVTGLDKNKDSLAPDEDGFKRNSKAALLNEKTKNILESCLYGYDIDVTMVRLGLMNLMMHGVDTPNIDYKDTLSKGFDQENFYDIVMANPPFTGSINKGDIHESLKLSTTKTELLFVERIFNMLKVGGTAGIIVPQGVLFGAAKAFKAARKILIEKSELKAVITLPSGVFKPYAGVATAILIFTKGGETQNVWFYDMEKDGYSLDDRRTKQEGCGDLQDIVERFKRRDPRQDTDRKKKCFFVPKKEIVKEEHDLSISRYKEDVFEEIEYEKPDVILKKLTGIEAEISNELNKLKEMI